MKNTINFIALLLISVLFQACFSLNSHQTAKTLGQGNVSFQLIEGASGYPYFEDDPNNVFATSFTMPHLQVGVGVKEKIDVGLTLGWNKMGLYNKYQMIGNQNSKFALASGWNAYFSKGNTWEYLDMIGLELPVYLSYHPVEFLSVYANPMLTYFDVRETGLIELLVPVFYDTGIYTGLSSGLMFQIPISDDHFRIVASAELSYLSPLNSNRYVFYSTLGLGLKWKTKWFSEK